MAEISVTFHNRSPWLFRLLLILCGVAINKGHIILRPGNVSSLQLQMLFAPHGSATSVPSERPLLLVLGDSAAALRHLRVSSPVPTLVGRASQLQMLAARMSPGPTYGPRAGAASVAVLLVERRSHGDQVTSLVEKLRTSPLWTARTKLILLLVDGDPSINLIPKDNPENASMAVHKDGFKEFKHSLEDTHNNGTRDFLNAISNALPSNASAWAWNSSLGVFQQLALPSSRSLPPVRYMGWPCAETLRNPGKKFVRDVGDAALAEEISLRVPDMRGAQCVECEPKGLGGLLPNRSYTGRLADLAHGYIDMMGYSFISYRHWAPIAELLYPHQEDHLCLETRRSLPLPFLRKALGAVSFAEYILIFFTIVTLSFVFRLVGIVNPLEYSVLYESPLLEIYRGLLFGQFCKGKIRFTYLLFILSLASTILTNGFFGTMASSLSVVEYSTDVNTLREAIEVANEICVPTGLLRELCSSTQEQMLPKLCKKSVECTNSEDYFRMRKKMVQGKGGSVVSYTSYFKLYSRFPELRIDDEIVIRQVPECILQPSYSSFVVRKDLPYAEKVSFLVQVIVQSGIYEKFSKDSTDIIVLNRGGIIIKENEQRAKTKPLSLNDIDKIFLYLVVMLTVCSLVFLFELHFMHFCRDKNMCFGN